MSWTPKVSNLTQDEISLLPVKTSKTDSLLSYKIQDIIERSEQFPVKFPVDSVRLKTIKNQKSVSEDQLTRDINSVYPFIHESVLQLYLKFIIFKRNHGTAIEKALYKDMTLKSFVDRLLKNRAVIFMGKNDQYLLIGGEKGSKNWESIGTDNEKPPLILKDCLSYDEVKLSAFLYVSSYTYFVNKGDRKNKAIYSEDRSGIQKEGIIAGLIGARLKKQGVMDFQEIVVTPSQNKESNGYGLKSSVHQLFADFFEEENLVYESVVRRRKSNNDRYVDIKTPKGSIFDNTTYKKRLTIVFDCLLLEANFRAREVGKKAYIHVVGLGLGVWRISPHQEKVFVDCFYERIMAFSAKLTSISDICLSYINQESCGGYKHGSVIPISNHPDKGIKIHIYKRSPHEKLSENEKLLYVSYAWDGNALPGNEFWMGKLGSSGDSAAASSTQITELHNPHINPLVCAENLRIITNEGDCEPLKGYCEKVTSLKRKQNINVGEPSGKKLKTS